MAERSQNWDGVQRVWGENQRIWLLVGDNARTARFAEEILANPHLGIIDEVVDLPERPGGPLPEERQRFVRSAVSPVRSRVVRGVEAIRDIVASRVIDDVVITLPVRSYYDEVQDILKICSEAGIPVTLPSPGYSGPADRTEVSLMGSMPMVTHRSGPSSHTLLVVKWMMDKVGAAVGLVVLFPLLLIIAVAVKLSSQGPVLFFQTRVGLKGRHFRMIKFRTMERDAPAWRDELQPFNQTDGTAFKMKNDPRITRVGRILRRFHLDELPQLWNVLAGQLSLVGPRPLPPEEAHGNEWWQRRRLSMPPGLTCIWQVQGDHTMPFRQWMESDVAYIDNWSIGLDLKLIVWTLATVVRGKGW